MAPAEAVRNLDMASQQESGSFELWRLMASGYSQLNDQGMTSLARAEMAALRGQRAEAQALIAKAKLQWEQTWPMAQGG